MFKFAQRVFQKKKLKSIPFDKKVRVLRDCIGNVISCKELNIPAFQRIDAVMNYILQHRLIDYYFENRRMIPALCAELICL